MLRIGCIRFQVVARFPGESTTNVRFTISRLFAILIVAILVVRSRALSTNTPLAKRMPDIIDVDTGQIISGESTIEQMGEQVLDFVIQVASGEVRTKAEQKSQEDFIPWKRGASL